MQNKAWYAGSCDRHTAEAALLRFNKVKVCLLKLPCSTVIMQLLFKEEALPIPLPSGATKSPWCSPAELAAAK